MTDNTRPPRFADDATFDAMTPEERVAEYERRKAISAPDAWYWALRQTIRGVRFDDKVL